jgi:hypothetical protein
VHRFEDKGCVWTCDHHVLGSLSSTYINSLHLVYTYVHATSLWLVAFICYLVYAVLSLHNVSGLSKGKQFGVFVNVSFF